MICSDAQMGTALGFNVPRSNASSDSPAQVIRWVISYINVWCIVFAEIFLLYSPLYTKSLGFTAH